MAQPKYATLEELGHAIAKLEERVPSRWEVRTLILAAIVVTNFDVPKELTTPAIVLAAALAALKGLMTLFRLG